MGPTGEAGSEALRLDFDRCLRLQFRGAVITFDAGLLAYRELDGALGLTAISAERVIDARPPLTKCSIGRIPPPNRIPDGIVLQDWSLIYPWNDAEATVDLPSELSKAVSMQSPNGTVLELYVASINDRPRDPMVAAMEL